MSTPDPVVSIVMPTFNRAHVLGESVGSALAQTVPGVEVIVVDDGSTDATADLLGSIDDPRLVVRMADHGGAPAARNVGVRAARGRWLLFLDSDDTIAPDHVESLLGGRDDVGVPDDVGVVYSGFTVEDVGTGKATSYLPRHLSDPRWALGYLNAVGAICSALLRAAVVREVGGWDEALPARQDTDLLYRLAGVTRFAVGADRADGCTVRHGSDDQISANPASRRDGFVQFLAKHRAELPLRTRVYLSKRALRLGLDTHDLRTILRHLPMGTAGVLGGIRVPPALDRPRTA